MEEKKINPIITRQLSSLKQTLIDNDLTVDDVLKYLKDKGYKTFDKWFDENYDNEPNRDQRSIMISKELKRLNELSMEQLYQMRNEMKEVCQHNQLKYKELYDLKYSDMEINKDISDVLDEIWSDLNKN